MGDRVLYSPRIPLVFLEGSVGTRLSHPSPIRGEDSLSTMRFKYRARILLRSTCVSRNSPLRLGLLRSYSVGIQLSPSSAVHTGDGDNHEKACASNAATTSGATSPASARSAGRRLRQRDPNVPHRGLCTSGTAHAAAIRLGMRGRLSSHPSKRQSYPHR